MPDNRNQLTSTQNRVIDVLLLLGALAYLFKDSLPDPVMLIATAFLGAGLVFLMAPAWVAGRWRAVTR